nr:glucosidase [uncultured Carboxylicivirga sp.]
MKKQLNERIRLALTKEGVENWHLWGPYLSERQWGTVREDYSEEGDAWNYFSHAQSLMRAYRWGEDGIAGISDDTQQLCLAFAFWNGKDPILKERLFGLTNNQGNHGEDVKEYYFYKDNTPTHSYMKYIYMYPQNPFPYSELIEENAKRTRQEDEFELIDTGIFDQNEYFEISIEYAKVEHDDIFICASITNRGPEKSQIHLLPTLWFRNTWSWEKKPDQISPTLKGTNADDRQFIMAHYNKQKTKEDQTYYLYFDTHTSLLFCNNDTNNKELFNGNNCTEYTKDGINNYVINNQSEAINPYLFGTKASAHYILDIESGEKQSLCFRLSTKEFNSGENPFENKHEVFQDCLDDANAFYKSIAPDTDDADVQNIFRQAKSGMLWTKQYYEFDVSKWLSANGIKPWVQMETRENRRNASWYQLKCQDILSMPDKWEYPWFAAWDLAFHMIPFMELDPDFTKMQLKQMLSADYMSINGQIPAYEWNFSDVNPPVHAWAVMETYLREREGVKGRGDKKWLAYCFQKLSLNFNWWLNRKDPDGNNLFEGGFLGLDNIGVFDRSNNLPTGGSIEQADGTSWMAFFSLQMFRMAIELSKEEDIYNSFVFKYFMQTIWIAGALNNKNENGHQMWDEEDNFFYDLLHFPDGETLRLKTRSLVGLLPLMSVCILPQSILEEFPQITERVEDFANRFPEIYRNIHRPGILGEQNSIMVSILNKHKLTCILNRMLDEEEFLSPYGIRSLSKFHEANPYVFEWGDEEFKVEYIPGESDSDMFGGNSNWRGPIWIPTNILLLNSLLAYYTYYGDSLQVECPTGSGNKMHLLHAAQYVAKRVLKLFLKDENGQRPYNLGNDKFRTDPNWADNLLFYEYFNAETGKGLGASHQTGWTGCITDLMTLVYDVTEKNFNKNMHLVGNITF